MGAGGRLNLFQRMMLRWRDLHPYNPVHVVRVPVPFEPERLRLCIAGRIESLGLTGLAVDRSRWRFAYEGGPAQVELTIVKADGESLAQLSRLIECEFNRPFAPARQENPFRFVAIDEGSVFQLALTYDHHVAGGDSIVRLLSGIACAYLGRDALPLAAPMERYSATYRSVFLRHPLWLMRSILGLPQMVANARRAFRPRYDDVEDGRNAFSCLRLGSAQVSALRDAARAWDVTLNDLLMACLMLALSPLAAARRLEPRRHQLALASILNMRHDFGPDAHAALSPFLAAFRVAHTVPEGITLRQLAQDLHAATQRIKRGHLYLQSILALGVSAWLWPRLTVSRRHGLYPKHFPVWAGITLLHVDPIWARSGWADTARLDYLRAVPTGPLCPLVFAVTTAHDAMHIGIASRMAAFSRAEVAAVTEGFLKCIEQMQAQPLP
ncbi:MAG: hypothetical protein ACRC2B_24605 [Rubrivivax sp.]